MIPRVLVIAGSDSGGGAGIQADIKTVTMLGGHAATAITAITAQNTLGVQGIHMVPGEMVRAQIAAVLGDIGCDAIKIGMLGDAGTIATVAEALREAGHLPGRDGDRGRCPLVLDPVMVAKGGAALLAEEAVAALKAALLPLATLVTPNAPELAVLSGMPVEDEPGARMAALELARAYGVAVLTKGGHLPGECVVDLLVTPAGEVHRWEAPRLAGRNTHGTGCTLASAIATGLAAGLDPVAAVEQSRGFVRAAMAAAPGIGAGHGPMGHALGVVPYAVIAGTVAD